MTLAQELQAASKAADNVLAEIERLRRVVKDYQRLQDKLEGFSDVIDGPDGPQPNLAMQILTEWEQGL